ncbi:Spo0E family sporulation regulatory protein-aspartic acid phosphatase [Metabacillus endolithicus]|uniref:Spo0E family sporulation regulatory protein-aspartic acid phosphatase n=1 Tax=Metabacillus endolithicus TaxID=1535204 RepID=A0ABW5C019_9BACI
MNSSISRYSNEKTELINRISSNKNELITIGLAKGLNHPLTISQSQKLDKLILQYQKLMGIDHETSDQ